MTLPENRRAADLAGNRPLVDCLLCGSALPPDTHPTSLGGEKPLAPTFRSCPNCGVLIPTATGGDLVIGTDEQGEDDAGTPTASPEGPNATTLAWTIAEHLPTPSDADPIIDLSVGRGHLLNALRRLGYAARGCEQSAFLCQMARASFLVGPDVLVNTDPDSYLADLVSQEAPISAIVLSHVLGRRSDPIDLIDRCLELVADGLLVLEFPVATTTNPVPAERFVPTPPTLVHLAEQFDLELLGAELVDKDTLRVLYRTPGADVVDLDQDRRRLQDDDGRLAALTAAYGAASPAFANVDLETDRADRPAEAQIGPAN